MKKVIQSIIGLYFLGMTAVDCAIGSRLHRDIPSETK